MEYKKLTDIFFETYSKVNYILLSERIIKLEEVSSIGKDKIIKETKQLLKELKKVENEKILLQGLIDRNYTDLKKLRDILLGIKINEGRSISDKIFTKILKFESHMPLGITIVFENYIKGITYFSNEKENKDQIPIYHRASSCGNKKKNFRNLLKNTLINEEIKKNHIKKCYLERLIYDDMYREMSLHFPTELKNQELKQNKGHEHQLTERAKNYYNYYLEEEINIEILYENNFPILLTINYIKNGKIIKIERYLKTTYIDDYGNTQYSENVYYTEIKNGKEKNIIQKF
jgi:hypothetical protein